LTATRPADTQCTPPQGCSRIRAAPARSNPGTAISGHRSATDTRGLPALGAFMRMHPRIHAQAAGTNFSLTDEGK
jgi:hypothetical protein